MKRYAAVLAFLLLCPLVGFAQTKEPSKEELKNELVSYITGEFKSFESASYSFKEISFSQNGDAFTLKKVAQGEPEVAISFQLKNVDIYKVTTRPASGVEKHYLLVRSRGRDTSLTKNGQHHIGDYKLTPSIDNGMKIQAMERAFNRLITLTTTRKTPYSMP